MSYRSSAFTAALSCLGVVAGCSGAASDANPPTGGSPSAGASAGATPSSGGSSAGTVGSGAGAGGGVLGGASGVAGGGAGGATAGAGGSGGIPAAAGAGGAPSAGGSAGATGGTGGTGGTTGMAGAAGAPDGSFKVFMIASTAPEHTPMSNAAIPVMQTIGAANHFTVDSTSDPSLMTDENLAKYQVFVQMQLGSFEMPPTAQAALQKFIESGKGWVGVHAAGLTGIQFIEDKDGKIIGDLKYWPWYTSFVGGDENFVWSIHPQEQMGTLKLENRTFPATKNLPASFKLTDEWYEWKENPRPNVTVLGTADETTYTPVNRQGDHPIIWSNPKYPHTIYIGVGHDKSSLTNQNYLTLLRDSVLYAAGKL
jgi:type 1 glutamine amidotransferase